MKTNITLYFDVSAGKYDSDGDSQGARRRYDLRVLGYHRRCYRNHFSVH